MQISYVNLCDREKVKPLLSWTDTIPHKNTLFKQKDQMLDGNGREGEMNESRGIILHDNDSYNETGMEHHYDLST